MSNTKNTEYSSLGSMLIIPQADMEDLQSPANKPGDVRVGGDSLGKRAGMRALVSLTADGTYKEVFALGADSSDAWRVVDGSANYTPVNLSTWTASEGCTYTSGLLTADGVDDPTATQTVALKAGTYRLTAEGAGEGTYDTDYHTVLMTVTGATDGALVSNTWDAASDVTVSAAIGAENATPTEFVDTFTLTADQNVVFEISVVNEDGDLEAGSAYISISPLEATEA